MWRCSSGCATPSRPTGRPLSTWLRRRCSTRTSDTTTSRGGGRTVACSGTTTANVYAQHRGPPHRDGPRVFDRSGVALLGELRLRPLQHVALVRLGDLEQLVLRSGVPDHRVAAGRAAHGHDL